MFRKKYTLSHAEAAYVSQGVTSSSRETHALVKFRARICDLLKPEYDDHYLLKWLKARNFDVDRAELMFRESVTYRAKMQVDTLLQEYKPPEVLEKYMPGGFCGYDREGSPVLVELYGYMDMKGLLHSAKKSDIEKTKLLLGENVMRMLDAQSKKFGRYVDGMTVIIDMENVGTWMLWGPGIQMYAHMGRILQDNYPEIVKRSFIVNAPRMFPMLWKMFRPLVTEEMKKKVCVLGADYKDELLKAIDPDQLPAFLGGNVRDADGNARCPSKICPGGIVPEKYYITDLSVSQNLREAIVPRGDKHEVPLQVANVGSIIRWEFKTDGYDVGFGLFYLNPSGKRDELVQIERVNSHMVPEDGTHTCQKAGSYTVVFDNTYSWTRAKSISYCIDVLAPDDSLLHDLDTVAQGGSWERIADESRCTKL